MLSISRSAARLCIFVLVLFAFLDIAPVSAASVIWIANPPSGSDSNPCTFASPCQTLQGPESAGQIDSNGQVTCAQGTAFGSGFLGSQSLTVDCPGLFLPNSTPIQTQSDGTVIKIRHLTINGQNGVGGVLAVGGNGATLVLEDCIFENFSGTAIQISADGPYNLILRNVRIVNNGAGVVLKPAAGGNINATFDHVTIYRNNGGGIKTDTTNGAVTVDATDSVVSSNAGNGFNAVGGAGGQNMVSIKNSVIAKNGTAGIQANGSSAGVMVATTLLDQNASGALSVVNGGNLLTYGNNSIVGLQGSNFTGAATLK
jgi:Right handed beta helix region